MKKLNLFCLSLLSLSLISCSDTVNPSGSFIVKFTSETGKILDIQKLDYGVTPVFDGVEPTKTATKRLAYTFTGWLPEIAPVTEDVTYVAQFEEGARKYLVEWLDYDFTLIEATYYEYSAMPKTCESVTQSYSDEYYTYTFSGWNEEIKAVSSDQTYRPVYTKTAK